MLNVGRIGCDPAQPPVSRKQETARNKKIATSIYPVYNGEAVTRSHTKLHSEASKHSVRTKYFKTIWKVRQENLTSV